ncbi:MAG TPA: thioesterase family protein [Firmicutes bacterium]|nr:thioesterase family protein [Bacillota bacterium]
MTNELREGIRGSSETVVDENNTALTMGSGELEVFATPAMVALMEEAAAESAKPYIDGESTTVGTALEIEHISATPIGVSVRCESELCHIDGRKLVFNVTAYDNAGIIGKGRHERFIVEKERFMKKADSKRKN